MHNPDLGDSAVVVETIRTSEGVCLPASPAVIGFVGAGGFRKGVAIFEELRRGLWFPVILGGQFQRWMDVQLLSESISVQ